MSIKATADGHQIIQEFSQIAKGEAPEPSTRADRDGTAEENIGSCYLSDAFWESRPILTTIRTYAHSQITGADATFGCVLARLSAVTPPNVVISATRKGPASLNYPLALVGKPGAGKSSGLGLAQNIISRGNYLDEALDGVEPSSGEGFVEQYMGIVSEKYTDADGEEKVRQVRKQAHLSALFVCHEGESLVRKASGEQSTLWQRMRAMSMGQGCGDANATGDRTRQVRDHSYRWALMIAFQDGKADRLFDDAAGGTPQRFLFLRGEDPNIPLDPADAPDVPELPTLRLPSNTTADLIKVRDKGYELGSLGFPKDLGDQLYRNIAIRNRGEGGDDTDAHRDLLTIKTSALLAILDERREVNHEDWELACEVVQVSSNVRATAEADMRTRQRSAKRQRAKDDAHHQKHVEEDLDDIRAAECTKAAATAARALHKGGEPLTLSQLGKTNSRKKHLIMDEGRPALAHAIDAGWIVAAASDDDRERFEAGPVQPPDRAELE